MKSFYKILSLVLTLTMMVSFVAMPTAFAAIKYPVGDTSNYEVAATFVQADGVTEVTEVEVGDTVYLRLDLKKFSTLNSGYVGITLEGATFVSETNKLDDAIFAKDADLTEFTTGGTYASYGISTDVANLTSTNKKVKYYAFAALADMYLALYEVKVDAEATEVTATVSHSLMVGDANGMTGNIPAPAEGIILTNDSLAITTGGGILPDPDPVITYSYSAAWNDATTAKEFPENTTEDEIKAAVTVTKVTTTDGIADAGVVMTEGYTVALNEGNVTVTINEDPNAVVAGNLTYTIAQHVPQITYSYVASWANLTTNHKVFPENTTEDEIKAEVTVTRFEYADGEATGVSLDMTAGFTVVLNDGSVSITIAGEANPDVTCGLTYEVSQHIPTITYDYDVSWKDDINEFDYGTSDAVIKSNVVVVKYTFEDGIKVNTETLENGYSVELDNGIAVVTVDGEKYDLAYTYIDKVEYKNVVLNADDEYEYVLGKDEIAALVTVTVEKWVNDVFAERITLEEGAHYSLTVTFDQNYNDGRIDVELIGEYDELANPGSVVFERINPTITFSDATAALSQTEFPEGVDEAAIIAEVSAKAMMKVGNLQAEAFDLIKGEDYSVTVDLEAKQVTVEFASIFDAEPVVLDFTITPAVITYANPSAVLSNEIFGSVPEAADIIARLTVTADKLKDGVADGSVVITSDNYDVVIGEGIATITFKNAYAALEAVEVTFSVEEVTYGDPVIVVDGTISANGKSNEEIIAEAWTLITATRDVLTNGVVTDSEALDKEDLEGLGVAASFEKGKLAFTFNGAVIAEVSVSSGMLQFASANPETAHDEFVKFVGATLKHIFDNIKVKKDVFQIIQLNADEWETLTEAIANGDATVNVDGVTYDNTNLNDADSVVVGDEDSKLLEIAYKDVVDTFEVDLLSVATDYANEDGEAPVVSITTDKTEVQIGTDVTATVYVKDLVGNIETGKISILYSNAEADVADVVAADGFEILSTTIHNNEIEVVFTIDEAAYDAGAGIFTVTFDTTNSDVNAKLGIAINAYELTRIVDMGDYNEYKLVNATIGDNAEVTVTAGDVLGYDYEVSYASGKTSFYTDAEAVADVKVLAYTTTNGVRDDGQTPADVTAAATINANNGVITVDKDGVRITTLTYSIYEVSFEQFVAIETIGSVDDPKFVANTSVKLNDVAVDGASIVLDGRSIKASVAGIKAEGTYVVAVAVPGYTKATINVVVSKKATLDGYDASVVTGSKIYAGDISGDNRILLNDFSDVAGKYSYTKETKYDLYTGNDSVVVDNLDVTTMAHYFITLNRGTVSADGTTVTP